MILLRIYSSNWLFIATLVIAAATLLYTFGKEMIREIAGSEQIQQMSTSVTSTQVSHYFASKGYTVCSINKTSDSHKWSAMLIKDQEYITATVFTKNNKIKRFEETIM